MTLLSLPASGRVTWCVAAHKMIKPRWVANLMYSFCHVDVAPSACLRQGSTVGRVRRPPRWHPPRWTFNPPRIPSLLSSSHSDITFSACPTPRHPATPPPWHTHAHPSAQKGGHRPLPLSCPNSPSSRLSSSPSSASSPPARPCGQRTARTMAQSLVSIWERPTLVSRE